jgi:hypothetical protein
MHELKRRISGVALISTIALSVSVAPLGAHHGWSGYGDADFQISGTVTTAVSTGGPHATLRIRDAEGNTWDVVLAPPARTVAAGLKEGMIPLGAQVTAHGKRIRDAKKFEIKTERLTWNGRNFDVYPNR